jgi:glycosyltransferase involved in cell wall biosynthesis
MEAPSISIAIPVYNQVATVASTIESALEATRTTSSSEIVVSENHSTDGTAEVVAQYSSQVKVVRPQKHLPMAANWNFAVNSCSGDWVGMLSGDDRIYPAYIHALRRAIALDPNAVFAMGDWHNVNATTGSISRRRVLSLPAVATVPGRTAKALLHGPKASFSSYCFRRTAFDHLGGFDENYNLIQDWVLQFELSLLGSFVRTNAVISEYLACQIRPDLEASRAPLYVEDLSMFCSTTIWKAIDQGIPRLHIIIAAERHMARAVKILSGLPLRQASGDAMLRSAYERIGRERVAVISTKEVPNWISKARKQVRQLAESVIQT